MERARHNSKDREPRAELPSCACRIVAGGDTLSLVRRLELNPGELGD